MTPFKSKTNKLTLKRSASATSTLSTVSTATGLKESIGQAAKATLQEAIEQYERIKRGFKAK